MTKTETLTQLAARVEAGETGRELDARIEVAALAGHCWIRLPSDERRLRKGQVVIKAFPEELTGFADAEPVTTSLDAISALTERVLPFPFGMVIAFNSDRPGKGATASIYDHSLDDPHNHQISASAETEPAARLAALLRALAEKEKEE